MPKWTMQSERARAFYGVMGNGRKVCHDCRREETLRQMAMEGQVELGFTLSAEIPWVLHDGTPCFGKVSTVSNPDGTVIFHAFVSVGDHNWHGYDYEAKKRGPMNRYDITFTDALGREWYGRTIAGQWLATFRVTKKFNPTYREWPEFTLWRDWSVDKVLANQAA
jgi:hypothetical protein